MTFDSRDLSALLNLMLLEAIILLPEVFPLEDALILKRNRNMPSFIVPPYELTRDIHKPKHPVKFH